MINLWRVLFFIAAIMLSSAAYNAHQKAIEPDTYQYQSTDWSNDVGGSMQATLDNSRNATMHQASVAEYENTRNKSAVGAVVCLVVFFMLFLPWREMSAGAAQDGAEIAVKIGEASVKLKEVAGSAAISIKEMTSGSPIVGRHGLKTYSVADELIKWNELRESGVVSLEEFEEARARLLKRDDSDKDVRG